MSHSSRFGSAARAAALILTFGVLGACAGDDDADTTMADTLAVPMDTGAAMTPPPAERLNDAQIAKIVMVVNTADSAGGTLAQQKAQNAEVKQFGQLMVTDHGALNKQTQQLAQRLGVTPEDSPVSQQLQTKTQQTAQHLQGLSGAEYDRQYIQHEVEMHQQALQMLDQQLLPNAQNPDLKKLLQDARPIYEGHLQRAQQVQSAVGGTAAQPAAQ